MKVLFVIPEVYSSYPGAMVPHLGIGYAISVLRNNNIETKVIDMRLKYSQKYLLQVIKEFNPDLIGITAYSFSFDKTKELINFIHKNKPCPLVIGGPHVSAFRKDVFNQVNIDFAIKCEGEFPLLELCKVLQENNKDYTKIKNLIWKKEEEIIENEDAPLIKDLDHIPFPDFDSFELSKYIFSAEKRIPLATSRGCPYSCIYCSVKLSMGKPFRARSAENVVNEMESLNQKGWKYFDIVDDCFTMDLDRAKKICDLIQERNLKINWSMGNGIRADRVDEELLIKMKKAGCVFLAYGLESGDDDILKVIKKGITTEKALEAFKLTKKVGIKFAVNFILGHPTETYQKAMKTLNFAKNIPADYINLYNLIPYPHTELYEWVEKNGRFLVNKEDYLYKVATRVNEPVFETPEFTKKERINALEKGYALAKRTHLRYRFGPLLSTLIWQVVKNEQIYLLARKAVFGNKLGRKVFNKIKKGK